MKFIMKSIFWKKASLEMKTDVKTTTIISSIKMKESARE